MEQYYYNHMDKQKQAAYHSILQGITNLADEFQIPHWTEKICTMFSFSCGWIIRRFSGRRDINIVIIKIHRTLFLSRNICLIRENKRASKAMKSRVEKLVRPAQSLRSGKRRKYVHDLICQNVHYDKLKKAYSHASHWSSGTGVGVCEGIAKAVKFFSMRWESGV